MRLSNKNKIKIWYSNDRTETDEISDNGYYTGNTIFKYENVKPIKINLYPTSGEITEEIFGKNCNFDAIACTIGSPFNENTILFLNEPTSETILERDYDYYIGSINKSLNFTQYGLVRCIK